MWTYEDIGAVVFTHSEWLLAIISDRGLDVKCWVYDFLDLCDLTPQSYQDFQQSMETPNVSIYIVKSITYKILLLYSGEPQLQACVGLDIWCAAKQMTLARLDSIRSVSELHILTQLRCKIIRISPGAPEP